MTDERSQMAGGSLLLRSTLGGLQSNFQGFLGVFGAMAPFGCISPDRSSCPNYSMELPAYLYQRTNTK
jgi:hypothetical protein